MARQRSRLDDHSVLFKWRLTWTKELLKGLTWHAAVGALDRGRAAADAILSSPRIQGSDMAVNVTRLESASGLNIVERIRPDAATRRAALVLTTPCLAFIAIILLVVGCSKEKQQSPAALGAPLRK